MLVLGLDTTGAFCSVSLVNDAQILGHKSEKINRGHAERLAPLVAEVLAEASKIAGDVTRLAVCTGPGSFTGLRVALAFAKGFALPRKLPVIGINALRVKAFEHDPEGQKDLSVFQDIRRSEAMLARFENGVCLNGPRPVPVEDAKNSDAIEVTHIDTRVLAWLSMDLSPDSYPAIPLYSRAPDAKLPGGIDP